jgi:hypothetical protein
MRMTHVSRGTTACRFEHAQQSFEHAQQSLYRGTHGRPSNGRRSDGCPV